MIRVATALLLCLPVIGATVSISDFGAVGDAVNCTVQTTSGSGNITVTSTNRFSASDIGSMVLVFTGGAVTTDVYHQDYIGTITGVSEGTNLTVTPSLGATLTSGEATVGKNNTQQIKDCLASLSGTNDIVLVPSGKYLVLSDFVRTNGTGTDFFAIHIKRGGFTLQGQGDATLLGCGAWQAHSGACVRGVIFAFLSVTNNYPIVFDSLTFDGGVAQGRTDYQYWPADTNQGDGWDITHDSVVDTGPLPLHASKTFSNCTFQHWRGEMVKSTYGNTDGMIVITNCVFYDGNASGFNFSFSHRISNSRFEKLNIATEFYEGYMTQPSYFQGCLITNMLHNGLVFGGALTNHAQPLYTVSGNTIIPTYPGIAIFLNSSRNMLITGNTLWGPVFAGGSGYQGTDHNGDWTITNNAFLSAPRMTAPFVSNGDAQSRVDNVLFAFNTVSNYQWLATGAGLQSGVTISSNICINCQGGVNGSALIGEYFIDDGSNDAIQFGVNGFPGVTNSITYAYGANQYTVATADGPIFAINDSNKTNIPAGVSLVITNRGPRYAEFRESNTKQSVFRRIVNSGDVIRYRWTGTAWQDSAISYVGSATVGRIVAQ